jgi:hypothetical protein
MSDPRASNTPLYCPTCGNESVANSKCSQCEWIGCEDDDHNFRYEGGDRSVGLASCLECKDCGLQIDDDGRFDQEDHYA